MTTRTPKPLAALLADVPDVAAVTGSDATPVPKVTADSREVTPGAAYVAVRGYNVDGHQYIPDALARGAAVVVAEAAAPEDLPDGVTWVQVPHSERALGELASAFHEHPSRALPVFAVTGTNGKTTVSWLLYEVLLACGHRPGLLGTVETRFGAVRRGTIFTTPPSPQLHALVAEMRDAGCTHVVMEASSHGLFMNRMAGLTVAVGGFTNLTRDHMDFHDTMEAYADAKERLFREFAPAAAFNVDDTTGARFANRFRGKRATVSVKRAPADFSVQALEMGVEGTVARLKTPAGPRELRIGLVGRHNVENALVTLAMAWLGGVPVDAALEALARSKGAPGRLERVDGGRQIFVDYAHTPDALDNVLRALRPLTRGRLICVFGAGGDRDRGKRPVMGQVVERLADLPVVTSDNPRTEDPQAIIGEIVAGMTPGRERLVVPDRREAIFAAVAASGPDDVLLIAGKGHEDYQIVGTDKRPFDDRKVAADALAGGDPKEAAAAEVPAAAEAPAEPKADEPRAKSKSKGKGKAKAKAADSTPEPGGDA